MSHSDRRASQFINKKGARDFRGRPIRLSVTAFPLAVPAFAPFIGLTEDIGQLIACRQF